MKRNSRMIYFLTAFAVMANGCSGSGSSDPASTVGSAFSAAFPSELAVASPTSVSPTRSMDQSSGDPSVQTISADDSYEEKKDALETIVSGASAADCAINVTITSAGNANCYGPNLAYVNHPNAPSPDANSTNDDGGFTDNDGDGSLPGGDLGIWEAAETTGEACAAAQLNARIKGVASQVDAGMFAMAGLMCAAKVGGKTLPAVGEEVDVASALSGKVTINATAITLTEATIGREADSAGGDPVYVSTITGTDGAKTYSIRLKHIATSTDKTSYEGKLSLKLSNADGTKPGNCSPGTATGQTDAVSISYQKVSAASLKFELKSANFCGSSADPYESATNFSVDLGKKFANPATPTGWGNNANYFAASFNPSDMTGSYAFAWQAGVNDGNTRVFLSKIETAGSSATAWFGFGPAADSGSVGTIDRMICNWAGPNQNHTGLAKAQQQVMTLTAGKFTATSSNIAYDPTNTCTSDGTDGSGNAFSYSWTFNGATQNRVGNAVATDLVNLAVVTAGFTAPTVPTDIE